MSHDDIVTSKHWVPAMASWTMYCAKTGLSPLLQSVHAVGKIIVSHSQGLMTTLQENVADKDISINTASKHSIPPPPQGRLNVYIRVCRIGLFFLRMSKEVKGHFLFQLTQH